MTELPVSLEHLIIDYEDGGDSLLANSEPEVF